MLYNPQLETFIRAANLKSFSKAAESLYMSPTAVIKQINLLEKELGFPLFFRSPRGLILTDAGKSLYQDTLYLIQYTNDMLIRAKNASKIGDKTIRVGSSPLTPGEFLIKLWPQIHPFCPDTKFQLIPYQNTPENAREILSTLGQNIDLVAGIYDESMLQLRGCRAFFFCNEPVRLALPLQHPLAEKSILHINDLIGQRIILLRKGYLAPIDRIWNFLEQTHPEIELISVDFMSLDVFNRCENGDGLLLSIDAWNSVHPLLKLIPVEWDFSIPFGFLYAPNPSEAVKDFLSAVAFIKSTDQRKP